MTIDIAELKQLAVDLRGIGLETVAKTLLRAADEIERLRATPIQWRPVDEGAKNEPKIIARLHSGGVVAAYHQSITSEWYELDTGEEIQDGDIDVYCPLK